MKDFRDYFLKIKDQLECIKCAITNSTSTGATEVTLQEVLSTLEQVLSTLQAGSEFEARLVIDSDASPKVWLEVRLWDVDSGTWGPITYYLPGSSVAGIPIGAVTYLDPNTLLTSMLAQLIAINTDLDVALSTRASELTLNLAYLELASINSAFDLPMSSINNNMTAIAADEVFITSVLGFDDNYDTFERRVTYVPSTNTYSVEFFDVDGNVAIPFGTFLFPDGYVANSIDEIYTSLSNVKQVDNLLGNQNSFAVGGKAIDETTYSPAYTAADHAQLALDIASGRLLVDSKERPDATDTYTPSQDVSGALEASSVSKASAGVFYGLSGHNTLASAQWILVYNSATVPANGAVTPIATIRVAANSNFSFDSGKFGIFCSAGISWSNSTDATIFNKTLGAADCFVNLAFK